MLALERGWIPKGNLNDANIMDACHKEDNGLYLCIAKRNQLAKNIRAGIEYVISSEGTDANGNKEVTIACHDGTTAVLNYTIAQKLDGEDLYTTADCAFNFYWDNHKGSGATCDFGGTATLLEVNKTYTDDDDDSMDNGAIFVDVQAAELSGLIGIGIILGAFLGFALAMRYNKHFNKTVSMSKMGQSMKSNPLLSRSFGGFTDDDYMEIPNTY